MDRKEELQLRSQLLNERRGRLQAQAKLLDIDFNNAVAELNKVNAELKEWNQKDVTPEPEVEVGTGE